MHVGPCENNEIMITPDEPGFVVQGGGVVNALINTTKFAVRAITRDRASDKAKALSARGVEVVQASLDDPASLTKVHT
jgi:NmrA-like family